MSFANLMFVDDDHDDLEIFTEAVYDLSQSLIPATFENPLIALHQLHTGEIRPDLIFLDLNMPGITGEEFLRTIKSNDSLKDIPVIIMSTSSEASIIQEVKSMGAFDYIVKPNTFREIKAIFKKLLAF